MQDLNVISQAADSEEDLHELAEMFRVEPLRWDAIFPNGEVLAAYEQLKAEARPELGRIDYDADVQGACFVLLNGESFDSEENTVPAELMERHFCYAATSFFVTASDSFMKAVLLDDTTDSAIPAEIEIPLSPMVEVNRVYRYGNLVTDPREFLLPFGIQFRTSGESETLVRFNFTTPDIREDGMLVHPTNFIEATRSCSFIELELFNRLLGYPIVFITDVLTEYQLVSLDDLMRNLPLVYAGNPVYGLLSARVINKHVEMSALTYHLVDKEMVPLDDDETDIDQVFIDNRQEIPSELVDFGSDDDIDDPEQDDDSDDDHHEFYSDANK
jgi:hypothetical protein